MPTPCDFDPRRPRAFAAVAFAAAVAGIGSTVVEIALWLLFSTPFPAVLYRDSRLAAAILLGPGALNASTGFDPLVMAVATAIHFALSLTYAAVFCALTRRLHPVHGVAAGALLGAALYGVNMYGFTAVFPWFRVTRDWITFAAHVTFGATCVGAFLWACRLMREGK